MHMRDGRGRARGFSLIELMIVVVILGVIAAFAYPSYLDSVRKSRRTEAKQALTDLASRQEQYYNNTKRYTATFTDLGLAAAPTSENGYYTLGAPVAGVTGSLNSSFSLSATATALGGQNQDTACATMTYTSDGTKTPAGCW